MKTQSPHIQNTRGTRKLFVFSRRFPDLSRIEIKREWSRGREQEHFLFWVPSEYNPARRTKSLNAVSGLVKDYFGLGENGGAEISSPWCTRRNGEKYTEGGYLCMWDQKILFSDVRCSERENIWRLKD
jgi:hypothetical protein